MKVGPKRGAKETRAADPSARSPAALEPKPAEAPPSSFERTKRAAPPLKPSSPSTVNTLSVRTPNAIEKWKTPPPDVEVIPNTTGAGDWIEKWRSPKTGKWVHNYTMATIAAKQGDKFAANLTFAKTLPKLRKKIRADFESNDLRRRALATIVALIDQACFRVGNEKSADDDVFGATTLKRGHLVELEGDRAVFEYVGKKKVDQRRVVVDESVAEILNALVEGKSDDDRLFMVDGARITAHHVNAYLSEFNVTAKAFRTYHATRLARKHLLSLAKANPPQNETERAAQVSEAMTKVADHLGNTPAVCRSSYVDPRVVEAFMEDRLS